MNRPRIILLGIVWLAFALRVYSLGQRTLWYDEAFAILFASRSFDEMIAGTLTQIGGAAADVHPLFYYFSLHTWMAVAGDSAFVVRFYSVFFGIATLPIIFQLATVLFNRRVGMAAMFVLALAPFHIAYSQEARMYAQLGFWSAVSFLGFIRYARTRRNRWWAIFVLGGAGALYSHNLAVVSFAALGLWVSFDAIRNRSIKLWLATGLGGVVILVLWLPWLVIVPSQFSKISQAYWVPAPTIVTLLQSLLVFTFDFDNAVAPKILFPIMFFCALVLPALIALTARRHTSQSLMFATTLVIAPVIILFAISQWRPVYVTRALMPAFLLYVVLIGWMLIIMPRALRWGSGIALLAMVVASLPSYYGYAEFPRSPFSQAAQTLRTAIQPGDVVVHDNKLSYFPMYYYDRSLSQVFLADPAGIGSDTLALPTQQALQLFATSLDSATLGKSHVWLVIFQNAIDEAQGTHPTVQWMDDHYRRVAIQRFNDLNVFEYRR